MAKQDFDDVHVDCRRRVLLNNIKVAGGSFYNGENRFMKILRSNIVDGLDTDNQSVSSLYRFHRIKGRNPISAYIVARKNLSFLRERAVNVYLEVILNEVLQFREINGHKKTFYVEGNGIGLKLVDAYQEERESRDNRSLSERIGDIAAFRDSESGMG